MNYITKKMAICVMVAGLGFQPVAHAGWFDWSNWSNTRRVATVLGAVGSLVLLVSLSKHLGDRSVPGGNRNSFNRHGKN